MTKESMVRPRVFLDIGIDQVEAGRIVVELFSDVCPRTCENFRCLCTGEKGIGSSTGKALHYKNVVFHRVIHGFMLQAGDFSEGNGRGGESIYGGYFEDESFDLKHDKPFLLSMANRGVNTNGSQFFITTQTTPHLNGKHVVFGRVVSGENVVKQVESQKTDANNRPLKECKIVHCGELVLAKSKKKHKKHKLSTDGSAASTDDDELSGGEKKKKKIKRKHKHKKEKKHKKKHKQEQEAQATAIKNKENEADDEIIGSISSIKPEEIPEVPENRFLGRFNSKEKERLDEERTVTNASTGDSRQWTTRSGRKIKGRGALRYRTPSRSRSRSMSPRSGRRTHSSRLHSASSSSRRANDTARKGSETPPHWRDAQERRSQRSLRERLNEYGDSEDDAAEGNERWKKNSPGVRARRRARPGTWHSDDSDGENKNLPITHSRWSDDQSPVAADIARDGDDGMFGPALPPKPTSEAPKLHKKSKRDSYKHKTKKKASLASKRNSQEIGENGTAESAATTSLEEQRKSSFSYEDVVKSKWNTPSPHGHGFATIEEGESTPIADNKVAECERLDIAAEQVQDFHYNKTSKLSSSAKSGRKRKKRHRQRKTSQSASSNSSLVTPTKPKYPRRQMSNSPSNSSSSSNPKSQILSQTWQPSRSPTAESNLSGMHEQEVGPETCESQPESETHEDVDSEAKGVCRSDPIDKKLPVASAEDIKGRHRKKNTDSGKPVLMWQPPLEFGEEEEFVHEHIKKHKNSSKSKMKSRSKDANDVPSPTNDKEALYDKGQIINEAPVMPTHVETDKSNFETTNKHHTKEENNSTVPPLVKTPSNNDELDEMLFSALEMSPIGRTSDHSKAKTLLQIDARKRTISELRKKLEKEKPRGETATESGGNAGSMEKKAAESARSDQQSVGVATAAARTPSLLRFGVMSKYVAPTRPKIDTQEDTRAAAAKIKDVESIWSDDDVTNGESVGTGAKKPVSLLDQRRPNSVEAAVSDRKTPPVNLPADRVSTRVEAKDEVASEMHTQGGDGDDDDDDVDDGELRVSVPVEKKPIIFNIKLTKASAEETKSVHKASAKKSKKKKAKKKLEKKLKRHKAKQSEAKDAEKAAPATACPDTSTTSTTTTSATSSVSVPASSIGETAAAAAANATSPTDAQYRARLPHYPPFYPMPPMNYAGSPAPPNMPPSLYQHMYYQHFFAYQHQQNLRAAQQLQSGELPLLLPPFPHPPPPPLPCEDAPAKPPEPKKAFKSVSDYEVMNLFKLRDITQESVEKAWRKEKQELPELPSPPSSRASSRSDRRTHRRGRRRSSDVSRRRSSYSSRSSSRGSPRRSRRSRSRTRSYTSSSRSSYNRRSRYSSRRRRRRSGRRSRRRSYSTGSSSSYCSSDRSRSRSRSSRSSRRTRSASSATFRSSSAWSTSSSGSDIERPCRHYKSSSGARRSDKAEPSRGRSLTSPRTNKSRWSSDSSYSSDDRRRKSREKSWSDVSHDGSTDSD